MILDASFWVLISFLLFFAVAGRRFFKKILFQLDQRSQQISQQIMEATDLHQEAELAYLQAKSYLKKQKARHEKELKEVERKVKILKQDSKKTLHKLEKEFMTQVEERKHYLLESHLQEIQRKFVQHLLKKVDYSLKSHLTVEDKKNYIVKQLTTVE